MEKYGIDRRPPGPVSQTLVPPEVLRKWTSDLAYVVGMITADGTLRRERNMVRVDSTDYQWIETYQELLHISAPVYERPLKSGKTLYSVGISDPDYRAFLEEIGLTPAKSTERTLGPLKIPDVFFRDFLRGCIDGDGSIVTSSGRLYIILASVCRPFLVWVWDTVERLIGLQPGIYRVRRGWILERGGSKARQMLEWLYYAPDLPCLERKRAVWEKYLAEYTVG